MSATLRKQFGQFGPKVAVPWPRYVLMVHVSRWMIALTALEPQLGAVRLPTSTLSSWNGKVFQQWSFQVMLNKSEAEQSRDRLEFALEYSENQ